MKYLLTLALCLLPFFAQSDDAKDAAEDALRQEWSDKLTEMGLKEHDHAWVLEEEMKIAKRLLKIKDEKKRAKENQKQHTKKARKLISAYGFGKMPKYPKSYLIALELRWEDWWFLGKKARLVKLKEMIEDLEINEIDLRATNGQAIRGTLHSEMLKINKKKNVKITSLANQTWQDTWANAMETPWRLYKARKKGWSTELKRVGFHSVAIKLWEKNIENLFKEPESPGE